MGSSHELSEDDRRIVWEQFVEVYASSQEAYDSSIRTLASAGIGVTASIGTALHDFSGWGIAAAVGFLVSLFLNLLSYGTAQFDMQTRLRALRRSSQYRGAEGNLWTVTTTTLNALAGVAFIAGGSFLAAFVGTAT
jgi:hypothetical protein